MGSSRATFVSSSIVNGLYESALSLHLLPVSPLLLEAAELHLIHFVCLRETPVSRSQELTPFTLTLAVCVLPLKELLLECFEKTKDLP